MNGRFAWRAANRSLRWRRSLTSYGAARRFDPWTHELSSHFPRREFRRCREAHGAGNDPSPSEEEGSAFAVIDTHAGRGIYNIASEDAARTAEAADGIGRLLEISDSTEGPTAFSAYLDVVRASGANLYPGSPVIAARLKRAQDRLVAIEKHPEEEAALRDALSLFLKTRGIGGNGYARLPALLPPPERRGLVLIDPPYEAPDEFAAAARAVGDIQRRFATGIVLVWFPVKSRADADLFCGEVLASGASKVLRVDIDTAPGARWPRETLTVAGLLVINPPFGFDTEMRASLDLLAPVSAARRTRLRKAG